MFRGRGNFRGRRGRYSRSSRFVTKTHLNVITSGTKLRVPNDPPSMNPCPFFNLVLVIQGKGVKTFTDGDLIDYVGTQCGFSVNVNKIMMIKLQKIFVWQEIPQTTDKIVWTPLKAPITVEFYDIYGEGTVSVQGDYGTMVRYSKVGYLWPLADRKKTLINFKNVANALFRVAPVDTDQGWLIHVHLVWAIHFDRALSDDHSQIYVGSAPIPASSSSDLASAFSELNIS